MCVVPLEHTHDIQANGTYVISLCVLQAFGTTRHRKRAPETPALPWEMALQQRHQDYTLIAHVISSSCWLLFISKQIDVHSLRQF